MEYESYCTCGLGTEDIVKGGVSYLREIMRVFYFILDCLMLMWICCDYFSRSEYDWTLHVLKIDLQNEKCSCFERFPMLKCFLYTHFTFLRKKEGSSRIFMEILWIFVPLYFNFGCIQTSLSLALFVSRMFPSQPPGHVYYGKFWFYGVICAVFLLILRLSFMNSGRT